MPPIVWRTARAASSPPPLWGRDRVGGIAEHRGWGFPPPLAPPHKGEGNPVGALERAYISMIVEIGHFALLLALAVALVQAALPAWGAQTRDGRLMQVAEPAAFASLATPLVSDAKTCDRVAKARRRRAGAPPRSRLQTLKVLGIESSMSRTGNCRDNAIAQRFFCLLVTQA